MFVLHFLNATNSHINIDVFDTVLNKGSKIKSVDITCKFK